MFADLFKILSASAYFYPDCAKCAPSEKDKGCQDSSGIFY